MARLPRIVIPGMPHLVTQRGNRQERTFFNDGDYKAYRQLIAEPPSGPGRRSGPIA